MRNINKHIKQLVRIPVINREFDSISERELDSYHNESQADWDNEEQSFYFECLHRWHDRRYNYI
jgi:hypothetical protein